MEGCRGLHRVVEGLEGVLKGDFAPIPSEKLSVLGSSEPPTVIWRPAKPPLHHRTSTCPVLTHAAIPWTSRSIPA